MPVWQGLARCVQCKRTQSCRQLLLRAVAPQASILGWNNRHFSSPATKSWSPLPLYQREIHISKVCFSLCSPAALKPYERAVAAPLLPQGRGPRPAPRVGVVRVMHLLFQRAVPVPLEKRKFLLRSPHHFSVRKPRSNRSAPSFHLRWFCPLTSTPNSLENSQTDPDNSIFRKKITMIKIILSFALLETWLENRQDGQRQH